MILEANQQSCRKSKPTVNHSQGKNHNSDSCMGNDSDDDECIYCGELWSECNDDVIKCTTCLKWADASCADKDDDELIGDFCD